MAQNADKNAAVEKYTGQYILMPNQIIQSKEKTSLMESKIEVLAIRRMATNLKSKDKVDAEGKNYNVNYVELRATEIRALTDRSGGSLYDDIFNVSVSLKSKFYVMFDKESRRYTLKSLYGDISYDNGVMQIEYNPETEYLFKDLKANYTRLSLPILFAFHTNGGFQLYKLLKSFAFNLPAVDISIPQEVQPKHRVTYSLAELRMIMGFVDLNQSDIKREAEKRHPDFEKMVDMELKPKYKRWSDFNARVIKPGLDEINSISDIFISDIDTDSAGKGSKITEVTFSIQHNVEYYRLSSRDSLEVDSTLTVTDSGAEVLSKEASYSLEEITRVQEMIRTVDLSSRDAELLLQEAEGNLSVIERAYHLALKQEHIHNFMGWMRSSIRGNYSEAVELERGSREAAEITNAVQEQLNQTSTQERVWKKTQEKPDFQDFLAFMGYSLETLDIIFESPKEKVQLYADWRVGRLK